MLAIVMIGIPGSGKSTLALQHANESGSFILSADMVRHELYGDASIQGDGAEVFAVFYRRLISTLIMDLPVIIDNTNVKTRYRKVLLEYFSKYGYDVEYWLVDTPFDECLKRNSKRDRKVDEGIIAKMAASLQSSRILLTRECESTFVVRLAGDSIVKEKFEG